MDFATNFKRLCTEKGTSPTAVCKALNLSTSKVNLWNEGALPKQPVLISLAKHLDCSVMEFFADEKDIPKTEFALDEDEEDIIRIFRTLDRKTRYSFMAAAFEWESKHK